MIIKVCGLKFDQNLLDISSLDIDMVGYNFYAPSPRYVDYLLPDITEKIKKAGVFVNAPLDEIKEKKELYNLDYVQLHGDESVAFVKEVNSFVPVIKVFRINDQFEPVILQLYNFCDYFLFDTATEKFGGSGQKFEWDILNEWEINTPFLLSGGIGPDDVDEILKIVHPQFKGIDINSKFELSSGIKDQNMVNEFITDVRKRLSAPNPHSLKGRPSLPDSDEVGLSSLGVGGEQGNEDTSPNPHSLRERPTLPDSDEVGLSPLEVGGKQSNKDTAPNPHSLKGRPALPELIAKNSNEDEFTYDMFYGANPNIFEKAASLRRKMTSEELKVWDFLKCKPLSLKFRRQHPIDLFVADFYCHSIKLVIEIDGINHQYSLEADLNRDNIFISFGITILRITNNEVNSNLQDVINKILEEIINLKNQSSTIQKLK